MFKQMTAFDPKRTFWVAFCLGLFLVAACFAASSTVFAKDATRVFDSGYALEAGGVARWIDDNHLLFVGPDRPNPVNRKDGEVRLALLIWGLNKQPTIYKTDIHLLTCYRDGRLAYVFRDRVAKTRVQYFGPMGHETPLSSRQDLDTLNCRPRDLLFRSTKEKVVRPLREEDGYLDYGPEVGPGKDRPIFLRAKDGNSFQLPFKAPGMSVLTFEYYPFRRAYYFPIYRAPREEEKALGSPVIDGAYWVWPNGKSEKIDLPADMARARPTRMGFVYPVFGTRYWWSKGGLYLMTPQQDRKRLVKGSILELSVSPDGCKVAFSYAESDEARLWMPNKPSSQTLRVVSLCN